MDEIESDILRSILKASSSNSKSGTLIDHD